MKKEDKLYRVKKTIRREYVLRASSKQEAEKLIEDRKPCGEMVDIKTQVIR